MSFESCSESLPACRRFLRRRWLRALAAAGYLQFVESGAMRRRPGSLLLVTTWLAVQAGASLCQETRRAPSDTPPAIAELLAALGSQPSGDEFEAKVRESLWSVYPQGVETKTSLVRYLRDAEEGPAVAFAAVALVPFHDPSSVDAIVERALADRTSPTTRWWLLNAAPYVLSIGDGMYFGDGTLDEEARAFAAGLKELAAEASRATLGRAHARRIQQLRDDPTAQGDPDLGLALWHLSAYLIGTLDLRDEPILRRWLNHEEGVVFVNVVDALSYATGKDFLKPLRELAGDSIAAGLEASTAAAISRWWREYASAHPDGEWLPAVIAHLREAGYEVSESPVSSAEMRELARALRDSSVHVRFASARVLNRVTGTHFDLERIFLGSKYALSFLDPADDGTKNQERLADYWERRLR